MPPPTDPTADLSRRRALLRAILGPERAFYGLAVVFAIATSVLTLAVPFSVQVLISTVLNSALTQSVVVLTAVLLALLAFYGLLYAVQAHVMDRFERRFFARFTQEIVLRFSYWKSAGSEQMNREELANRFFEIVTVQRNVPALMVSGSATLLQSLVGILVVSAYHPAFIVFSVALVAVLWLVYVLFARSAIRTKIAASKAKFRVASRIEELGRVHRSLRSVRGIREATQEADRVISAYLHAHREHFGYKLSQIVGIFALYALGSAALLGVGGWLVIRAELTLGQLVAAELILSMVFASLTRLPALLDQYYELCAALDKLGEFLELDLERPGGETVPAGSHAITFQSLRPLSRPGHGAIQRELPAGTKLRVTACDRDREALIDVLHRHREPADGSVRIGAQVLADLDPQQVRDAIAIVEDGELLERSILQNLTLGDALTRRAEVREALSAVGLIERVDDLPDGLDTQLARGAYPLTPEEALRLKVAAALVHRPALLVLTTALDRLDDPDLAVLCAGLSRYPDLTVLWFSRRALPAPFDRGLALPGPSEELCA